VENSRIAQEYGSCGDVSNLACLLISNGGLGILRILPAIPSAAI
jgi:hypothetical protein